MTYQQIRHSPDPVPPLGSRHFDFLRLTLEERDAVDRYLRFELTLAEVPERGRVFLRRYHREN